MQKPRKSLWKMDTVTRNDFVKMDSVEVLGFVDNNKSVDWIAECGVSFRVRLFVWIIVVI